MPPSGCRHIEGRSSDSRNCLIVELLNDGRTPGERLGMSNPTLLLEKTLPEKTTLMLSNLHTAWLDEVAVTIRRRTGAAIPRSAIVRAMITAISQAELSLSDCNSEQAIRAKILSRLKPKPE